MDRHLCPKCGGFKASATAKHCRGCFLTGQLEDQKTLLMTNKRLSVLLAFVATGCAKSAAALVKANEKTTEHHLATLKRIAKVNSVNMLIPWAFRQGYVYGLGFLLACSSIAAAPKQGTIIVQSEPLSGGSVSGSGTYKFKQTITIGAYPFSNWSFSKWNDGNTNSSRQIQVPAGTTFFTANFITNAPTPPPQYGTIGLSAEPINGGSVAGAGTYVVGQQVNISAIAAPNWSFIRWQDGNSSATRTVTVPLGAVLYTATFTTNAPVYGTISASANPPQGGIVNGGGSFPVGQTITLVASPYTNWRFNNWSDGVTVAQRNVTVPNGTLNLLANFQNFGTITLTAEPPYGGTVAGGGTYVTGQIITISATPASTNWLFSRWQDGITNASRQITMPSGTMQMTATFVTNTAPTFHSQLLYWTPSPASDVNGYMVSWGIVPQTYTNSVTTSTTNVTIGPLRDTVTYFASVKSMASSGLSSVPSCELSWIAPGSNFCQ